MKTVILLSFILLKSACFAQIKQGSNSLLKRNQLFLFEENNGQMMNNLGESVPFVLFKLRSSSVDFYITEYGGTYVYHETAQFGLKRNEESRETNSRWERIDFLLKGASIKRENIKRELSVKKGTVNYSLWDKKGRNFEADEYEKITISDIYPNIDWVIYQSSEFGYKYDFVLHEGASNNDIQVVYRSREKLALVDGEISLDTQYGTLKEKKPITFFNGEEVASSFYLESVVSNELGGYDSQVSFEVGLLESKAIEKGDELIIDPDLAWNTFYGGSSEDQGLDVEVDRFGNTFVVGESLSSNFPVVSNGTYFLGNSQLFWDIGFIIKFDPNGTRIWSTYYDLLIHDICVDSNGNLYGVAETSSTSVPTVNSGSGYFQSSNGGSADLFLTKFDNDGNLLHATYFGGDVSEAAASIGTDRLGNVIVTASSSSSNFPVLAGNGYFQGNLLGTVDGTITRFDANLNILWSSYLGGMTSNSFTVNNENEIYLVGEMTDTGSFPLVDPGNGAYFQPTGPPSSQWGASSWPVITKFDNSDNLFWSTSFGSTTNPDGLVLNDKITSVQTDNCGNLFIIGIAEGPGLPIVDPGNNAFIDDVPPTASAPGLFAVIERKGFISRFDDQGGLVWSTYFGGMIDGIVEPNALPIEMNDLQVNQFGELIVVGKATDVEFPVINSQSGFNQSNLSGLGDGFISIFNDQGKLSWSTFLGGDGHLDALNALAIREDGKMMLTGHYGGEQGGGFGVSTSYPTIDMGSSSYFNENFSGGALDAMVAMIDLNHDDTTHVYASTDETDCNSCDGTASIELSGYIGPYDFIWSDGISTLSSDSSLNERVDLCAGVYTVVVVSHCDTILTKTFEIDGESIEFNHLLPSDTTLCFNETLFLEPVINNELFDYTWSDGHSDIDRLIDAPGTYTLNFTHKNCPFEDFVEISVDYEDCDFYIYVPNAFTPNNSGLNDHFAPVINGEIDHYNFVIFDRWGHSIFNSNDAGTAWDGTLDGSEVPSGVYVWKLEISSIHSDEYIEKVGHVTLLK